MFHKELLLKERIRSLWERILSFKRSAYFGKGTQLKIISACSSSLPLMCVTFFSVLATPLVVLTERKDHCGIAISLQQSRTSKDIVRYECILWRIIPRLCEFPATTRLNPIKHSFVNELIMF